MGRQRLFSLLRIAFAIALVAWIASRVSLSDAAERRWTDGGTERVESRTGRVEGAWTGERVAFRGADGKTEVLLTADGWRVQPGLKTLASNLRGGLYALTILVFLATPLITVVRWRMLLRAVGIESTFGEACRLTYIGLFFNLVVPGLTGGDLVKAILVARKTDRREAAVVSVFVDRVVGILALALFAGIVVWPQRQRFDEIAKGLYLFLAVLGGGSLLLLSRRLRRWLAIDRLLKRLPFAGVVGRVDEAVLAYRSHPRTIVSAFALSFANHLGILFGVVLCARALGDALPIADYFVLVPVINILSAAPIAPAGWGVGETLFGEFFRRYGSSLEVGVALSLLYRIAWMVVSLPGGLFWMRRGTRTALERPAAA